ncbi:DUF89 family protein [candidate division KSB1 bacterium]|nr:DUF89 family protein [candidate division KSB1 bacterium]
MKPKPKNSVNSSLDCIPCILSSFVRLLEKDILPREKHEKALRQVLFYLARADYRQSPPILGREIHRLIRELLQNPDPYQEIKKASNQKMLAVYDRFRQQVHESDDPFKTALRLAVAGNVIDYAPQNRLDIWETTERVLRSPLAVDDSDALRHALRASQQLLYIGDNAGEIVLDKLFLDTIAHPNVYFAVRAAPVINDATLEDALAVGIDKIAQLITTGDDAPGAVWETTSHDFKTVFNTADVVIAKGQGNLEGLIDTDYKIFFLFVAKCDLIASRVGAHKGDFVVKYKSQKRIE